MVQTTATNVMDEGMDASWRDFLHSKVNSFIKWDLIRFFHDNPHTVDTAESIAHYVGRDVLTCQRALDEMAISSILEVERAGDVWIYRLTQQPETRQLIRAFVDACHNREFRAKAIRHVMHDMSNYASA